MIEIRGLCKTYSGYPVLENVNMHLERGQTAGFVGANGSGKSVLLKMICGFVRPDRGEILVDGKRIGRDRDFPENAGIMIEEPGFFRAYSARQNMRLFAAHRGRLTDPQIDRAIEEVGLDPRERKPVGRYSMGMRQRLCFAQALMEEPELLILDEPFNSLDRKWAAWMREKIRLYRSPGRLILLTSHRQEDIDALCTCTYRFEDGQVIKEKKEE